MAVVWLATSPGNRTINNSKVAALAHAMKTGLWKASNSSIGFTKSGKLVDGHHRLLACVMSGVPFVSYVVDDMDEDAFLIVDGIGTSRSPGDVMKIAGIENGKVVAPVARLAMNYMQERPLCEKQSPEACVTLALAEPWLQEVARMCMRARNVVPVTALSAVIFLSTRNGDHRDKIEEFIYGLTSRSNLPSGSPMLRTVIWSDKERRKRGNWRAEDVFPTIADAWSAHVEGRNMYAVRTRGRDSIATLRIAGYRVPSPVKLVKKKAA